MTDRGGALVTGAAHRIGRALALSLAQAGYAVAVHHRDDEADAQALVAEIVAAGGRAATVRADLAAEAQTAALIAQAVAAVGPLTLLVNNASTFRHDHAGALDRATWDAHFEPNLRAPLVLAEGLDRKSTRLNSSHRPLSRMPSSA